jgi:hypothetical protein
VYGKLSSCTHKRGAGAQTGQLHSPAKTTTAAGAPSQSLAGISGLTSPPWSFKDDHTGLPRRSGRSWTGR